jgi:hypothetical protein
LAAVLAMGAFDLAFRGTPTSYGGERLSFDSGTGFPRVDPPTATWKEEVAKRGPANWVRPGRRLPYRFNVRTWSWDSWYFLFGRTVGLLPYYPAVLLALWACRRDRSSGLLLLGFAAVAVAFFATRPFNFFGGAGALANRYILPAYPALWFLARRPRSPVALVPFALLAAVFLHPLWAAPWRFPLTAGGQYRWVSPAAERWLPYETTQSHLKPAGREDFLHGRLWIKSLTPSLEPRFESAATASATAASAMSVPAGASVELVAGTPEPLRSLCLVPLDVSAASGAAAMNLAASGGLMPFYRVGANPLRLEPARPFIRHAMWWTEENVTLYRLRIASMTPGAGRARFRLAADCEGMP